MHFLYQSLSSTNDHAKELRDRGFAPPFTVQAFTQTHGRGRLGHQWQSQPGGLYVSFECPVNAEVKDASSLSLHCAQWVLDWVGCQFGLWLTIKWPNDLLFCGKKVAGILCEAQVGADGLERLCVGVGVNVWNQPSADTDSPAGALQDYVRVSEDLASLGRSLSEFFWERFSSWPKKALSPRCMIGEGHLFCKDGTYFHLAGYSPEGQLQLTPLGAGEPRQLHSSHQGYQWVHAQDSGAELGVFDLGNTRLKVARFDSAGEAEPAQVFSAEGAQGLAKDFWRRIRNEFHQPENPLVLFGSQVHSLMFAKLQAAAQEEGVHLQELEKRFVRLRQSAYQLNQLGLDRLCLLEAALSEVEGAEGGLLCVGVGTATTVDFIEGGHHHGGYIGASPTLQRRTLAEEAFLLSEGEQMPTDLDFAKTTHEALAKGCALPLVALIQLLLSRYQLPESRLFLAGGGAHELVGFFPKATFRPYGVLLGARQLALGGR